ARETSQSLIGDGTSRCLATCAADRPRRHRTRLVARNQSDFRSSTMNIARRTAAFAAAIVLFGFATSPAFADVKDYEFQLVQSEAKKGDATIAVRLVNKKTGKAVPDAVI